jgi:hypothetical protein
MLSPGCSHRYASCCSVQVGRLRHNVVAQDPGLLKMIGHTTRFGNLPLSLEYKARMRSPLKSVPFDITNIATQVAFLSSPVRYYHITGSDCSKLRCQRSLVAKRGGSRGYFEASFTIERTHSPAIICTFVSHPL